MINGELRKDYRNILLCGLRVSDGPSWLHVRGPDEALPSSVGFRQKSTGRDLDDSTYDPITDMPSLWQLLGLQRALT